MEIEVTVTCPKCGCEFDELVDVDIEPDREDC